MNKSRGQGQPEEAQRTKLPPPAAKTMQEEVSAVSSLHKLTFRAVHLRLHGAHA